MPMTKHMGRLASTGKKVAVIFRYIYDEDGGVSDDTHALVVDTDALPNMWADSFMDAIKSSEGQDTIDFFNVATRKTLPDGRFILPALVQEGRMLKIRSNDIIMEPSNNIRIPLDELNRQLVALESGKTEAEGGPATAEKAIERIKNRVLDTPETWALGDDAKSKAVGLRARATNLKEEGDRLEAEAETLDPQPKRGRGRPKKVHADAEG
jgi:hypothetical protein